jgi:hypothetical protein
MVTNPSPEAKPMPLKINAECYSSFQHEAPVGLGDSQADTEREAQTKAMPVPNWMQETRESQALKLKLLIEDDAVMTEKSQERWLGLGRSRIFYRYNKK